MELEANIDETTMRDEDDAIAYPFSISKTDESGLPYVDPVAMWQALLGDLVRKTPMSVMAARFHKGLAMIITTMVCRLVNECKKDGVPIKSVALSGGCFQNRVLLEEVSERLSDKCYAVLRQSRVPANDGGLALGQAAIAVACYAHKPNEPGVF